MITSCNTPQSLASKDKKTEILLVGVFHHIPDSLSCNWQSVYNKILRYKPDQISVEYVIPSDSASQIQALGKDYRHRWDSFMIAWEGAKINAEARIQELLTAPPKKKNVSQRIQLWKYYYLSPDLANRDYQAYLLYKNMDSNMSFVDTFGNFSPFFKKTQPNIVKTRKESEFFNLVFPLADALGIPYLYPTDERAYYPDQSEAYEKWATELENTAYMKRVEDFWKEFIATEAAQILTCNALEFINSKEWLAKTDYGQTQILADANNPHYGEYVKVWYKRNESIAHRIIKAAEASEARKMVAFYGYMHVAPVKKFLEQQGFTVKLVEDLK